MDHMTQITSDSPAVIGTLEAQHRAEILGAMKEALAARGVDSVLVTRHRLILHADGPYGPSGPTEPQLYIFAARQDIATTDGRTYRFASAASYPVSDLETAVRLITVALAPPGRPAFES